VRGCFDNFTGTMTAVLKATSEARRAEIPAETGARADRAAALLKRKAAPASAVINSDDANSGAHPRRRQLSTG